MSAPARYRSFCTFASDPANDPFVGNNAAVVTYLDQWKAGRGAHDNGRMLVKAAEQFSDPAIGAIMITVVDNRVPKI